MSTYKLKDLPSEKLGPQKSDVELKAARPPRDDEPTEVTRLLDDMRESLHGADEATTTALEKGEEVRRAARRKGSSPSLRLLISKSKRPPPLDGAGTPDGT